MGNRATNSRRKDKSEGDSNPVGKKWHAKVSEGLRVAELLSESSASRLRARSGPTVLGHENPAL